MDETSSNSSHTQSNLCLLCERIVGVENLTDFLCYECNNEIINTPETELVNDIDTYLDELNSTPYFADYEALEYFVDFADSNIGSHVTQQASISAVENGVIGEKDHEECAICLELMDVGDVSKKLPCGHIYHNECITTWLFSRNSCPVCRFKLPTDIEDRFKLPTDIEDVEEVASWPLWARSCYDILRNFGF